VPALHVRFQPFWTMSVLPSLLPRATVGVSLSANYRAAPVILCNLGLADLVKVVLGLLIGPAVHHLTD